MASCKLTSRRWKSGKRSGTCKCSVLTMSRKQTTNSHQNKSSTTKCWKTSVIVSTKYFGITLQHNAKFNQHIDTVVAKASRTLGILRSNLRIRATNIKAQAYKSNQHQGTSLQVPCAPHPQVHMHALCGTLQHRKTLTDWKLYNTGQPDLLWIGTRKL